MGKKKFIDKKKSATFQLLARDSSDPIYDGTAANDRVFVRVDNRPYSIDSFADANAPASDEDPNSIFADAPDDFDDYEDRAFGNSVRSQGETGKRASLPDHIRKEILELGFPDDGYNYLLHLREIKNTGGGSAFFQNPKARLDQLPRDVKAYDASRVGVCEGNSDADENFIYKVASKTVDVRVQHAFDPEVASLLDNDDLSRFGSDAEDLEEDFVAKANLLEEGDDTTMDNKLNTPDDFERIEGTHDIGEKSCGDHIFSDANIDHVGEKNVSTDADGPRIRRVLDEQFDTLLSQEYASSDNDGSDYDEGDDCVAEEEESLAQKLKHTLGDYATDDMELDKVYKAPADILNSREPLENKELLESAANVIQRCMEYAEMYQNEDDEDNDDIFEESSDESEVWDCETIISTCSIVNQPWKMSISEITGKKKSEETVSGAQNASSHVIALRGKEKLPVDFLPSGRKPVNKVKDGGNLRTEHHQKRKQHGQESKEEKKERKAAVKEERREARRMKKEMKELYKGETQRARKVVAISGPSTIHIT